MAEKERFEKTRLYRFYRILFEFDSFMTLFDFCIQKLCGVEDGFFSKCGVDIHGGGKLLVPQDFLYAFDGKSTFKGDSSKAMSQLMSSALYFCLFLKVFI